MWWRSWWVCRWCPGISSRPAPKEPHLDLGQWNQRASRWHQYLHRGGTVTHWPHEAGHRSPPGWTQSRGSRMLTTASQDSLTSVTRAQCEPALIWGERTTCTWTAGTASCCRQWQGQQQNTKLEKGCCGFATLLSPVVTIICTKAGESDDITCASYVDRLMSLKFNWLGVTTECSLHLVEQRQVIQRQN